jgi:hypothetical protein
MDMKQIIEQVEAEAARVWGAKAEHVQAGAHVFRGTAYVSVSTCWPVSRKAEGKAADVAAALAACLEALADQDPVLHARTLGIEAA